MAKTEITYTLDHEDVIKLVQKYFLDEYNIAVNPEELHFNLREYRPDEGYGGWGQDQKTRINSIWFKR